MTVLPVSRAPLSFPEALEEWMETFLGHRAIVQLVGSFLVDNAMLSHVFSAAVACGDAQWQVAVTAAKASGCFLLKHHEIVERARRLNHKSYALYSCDEIILSKPQFYDEHGHSILCMPKPFYLASNQRRWSSLGTQCLFLLEGQEEPTQFWILVGQRIYSITIRLKCQQLGKPMIPRSFDTPVRIPVNVICGGKYKAVGRGEIPLEGSLTVISEMGLCRLGDLERFPEEDRPPLRQQASVAAPPVPIVAPKPVRYISVPCLRIDTLDDSDSKATIEPILRARPRPPPGFENRATYKE